MENYEPACRQAGYELKIKIILFIFLFFGVFGLAKNTWATTLTAANCSLSEVQAKVNAAGRGDTVIVPAGSCAWDDALVIRKAIALKGNGSTGANKTKITTSKTSNACVYLDPITGSTQQNICQWLIKYYPSDVSADSEVPMRITGFELDVNFIHGVIRVDTNFSDTPIKKLRIDNNVFTDVRNGPNAAGGWGYDYTTIRLNGVIWGSIDSNTMTGFPHIRFYGYGSSYNGKSLWNTSALHYTPGGERAMYVENNTFNYDKTGNVDWGQVLTSSGYGGSYVYRYNTYNFVNLPNVQVDGEWIMMDLLSLWDTHGHNVGNYATQGFEAYGNIFNNTSGNNSFTVGSGYGGSQHLMFFNKYINSYTWFYLGHTCDTVSTPTCNESGNALNVQCNSATAYNGLYQCRSTGGFTIPQHIYLSYFFNNREGVGGTTLVDIDGPANNNYTISQNSHWFEHNTGCTGSSCTAGVGCGSTLPTGCTVGMGYFRTDQTCSSIDTENIGANPAEPISGTLYRCSSTNIWTAYYTPYTYPHPLRSGTSNTAPASPTGVTVR